MDEKKEYIERGALLEKSRWVTEYDEGGWGIDYRAVSEEEINNAPAADVVEVVRCKDCKYAYINSFSAASGVVLCKELSNAAETAIRQQDEYCSHGERKEE